MDTAATAPATTPTRWGVRQADGTILIPDVAGTALDGYYPWGSRKIAEMYARTHGGTVVRAAL